jgi:hypothetical protein
MHAVLALSSLRDKLVHHNPLLSNGTMAKSLAYVSLRDSNAIAVAIAQE